MFRPIVACPNAVTLVGGGEANATSLTKALSHAPTLVAADGGAAACLAAGHVPDAVIGDFDSLSDDAAADIPQGRLHHVASQDDTDFDKCLKRIEAPGILGVGFLGGRIDHQLAAFSSLMRDPRPIVLISKREVVFMAPRALRLRLAPGDPIAFYPLRPVELTTRGVRYPLAATTVAPDGIISTSNHVADPEVEIVTDRAGVLVTMPLAALEPVLDALWPHVRAK
ncbi:MAG: thiamine diphosphokinase [Pseudomonadota bacterium]